MSLKCNARCGKYRQLRSKGRKKKEKADCTELPQLAESVRLATPLARFGKIDQTATSQKVGSSSPPGRATHTTMVVVNTLTLVLVNRLTNPSKSEVRTHGYSEGNQRQPAFRRIQVPEQGNV